MRLVAAAIVLLLGPGLAGCLEGLAPPTDLKPVPQSSPARLEVSMDWTPRVPRVGETVTFEPTVRSVEPDDRVLEVLWRVEGIVLEATFLEYQFQTSGHQEVVVQVRTEKVGLAHATEIVEVLPSAGGDSSAAPHPASGYTPPPRGPVEPPVINVSIVENAASFSFTWGLTADQVFWDFGDGATSNETAPMHTYLDAGTFDVVLRVASNALTSEALVLVKVDRVPFQPHVIVAIGDSGINPYHETYYRPQLTAHPCTYVRDFPCNIPALPLSVGKHESWEAAFAADRDLWSGLRLKQWYWIPQTVFVAVQCDGTMSLLTQAEGGNGICILDDTNMHGTGTTSSVLSENPDALLIFKESNANMDVFQDGTFPIDVISYSWGAAVPIPLIGGSFGEPFFVAASGNEGAFPVVLDGRKANPRVINVGAADGATRTEPGYSGWKTADFVSEYCRPTAQTRSISGVRESYCGTSFSAPTFAGALSRVILEVRQASGYNRGMDGDMVDPILGITRSDVRHALNASASYEPDSPFPAGSHLVPLATAAPYYQWGWGYMARNEVPAAVACLLEGECASRPADTVAFMEALWTYRTTVP